MPARRGAGPKRPSPVAGPPAVVVRGGGRLRLFFTARLETFRLVAAAASGLLLAAAYPPLELGYLAWIALVPLGVAVRGADGRRAARAGLLAGTVFWLLSLAWLNRVTTIGWGLLSLYCALYFVPPALLAARWPRPGAVPVWLSNVAFMIGWTAVWTGGEFLRGTLGTGFPWNPLGVSQFDNPPMIQGAAWGGVWAVSALVAWVNAGAIATIRRYAEAAPQRRWRQPHPELMLAFLAVVGAFVHGWRSVAALPPPDTTVRVALIQPAIPQYAKWDEEFVAGIYERLVALSEAAQRAVRPELLVWPETAVPGDVRNDEAAWAAVRAAIAGGAPLLAGALEVERGDDGAPRYFNSALLIGADGAILETYDKQHLVLFGEYVPFSRRFPFLRRLTPAAYDVEPGGRATVFRAPRPDAPFASLICFEDVFPYLSRRFARAGARWFINQTNDAWYDISSGSRQHLAHAVFRCVETRRPMARAANTGITGWIDVAGRIGGGSESEGGLLPHYTPDGGLAAGFLGADIPLLPADAPPTPYLRRGDLFAGATCAIALGMMILVLRPRRT